MEGLDPESWPTGVALALDDEELITYEKRREALLLYKRKCPLKRIFQATSITRQGLYRLIHRCLAVDADGRPFAHRALLKHVQIKQNRKINTALLDEPVRPKAGMFRALLLRYPTLEDELKQLVLKGKLHGSNRSIRQLSWSIIHREFLDGCVRHGINAPSYPFSSKSQGLNALKEWGQSLRGEQAAASDFQRATAMEGKQVRTPPEQCFERVECDGHRIDLRICVEVPGLNGVGVTRIRVKRLWLIALIEAKSGAVLGFSVAFGENYAASDVARALNSALIPWKPRSLKLTNISYRPGECLPSGLSHDLAYICPDEIWLDNAKSHLSSLYLSVLERTTNSTPVFGPAGQPNARPNVELLFGILEEAGFHQLDGTTGSNSSDPRRDDSDQYKLELDELLDVIDLLVCRYNSANAPGTTISRNEVLLRAVRESHSIIRYISHRARATLLKYDLYDICKIGSDKGRPVLRWMSARYTGIGLASRAGLIGSEVLIRTDSFDVRKIEVTLLSDGTLLGVLEVEPRWRGTAHTIWARKAMKRMDKDVSFLRFAADIPRAALLHTERMASKSKSAANFAARLHAEKRMTPERSKENAPSDAPACDEATVEQKNNLVSMDEEVARRIAKLGSTYRG